MITKEEAKKLISLARKTVESELRGNSISKESIELDLNSNIKGKKAGLFVTIKKDKKLRGCIGFIQPLYTIPEGIINAAKAAAFEDPRFEPIVKDELKKIEFEISILSSPKKIESEKTNIPQMIKIGETGIIIRKGTYSGVLLPQVAEEFNLTEKEFIEETCIKAGLKKDDWKKKEVEIYLFNAEIFYETDEI